MRTSPPFPCGCVVVRNDDGSVHDVIRCQQHKGLKNTGQLMSILNIHPVLDVQITDSVTARDRMGR